MLATLAVAAALGRAPSTISCERCTIEIAGTRAIVRGTLGPDRFDATVYAARLRLGDAATVHDVVVTLHGRAIIHTCAAGTVLGARLVACADVPRALARVHTVAIAWHVLGGSASGRIELRAQTLAHRIALRVERATATALGGSIDATPFDVRAGATTTLHVHGVELARVLELTTASHVHGSGRLDGDIELRADATGLTLAHGALRARGGGAMQIPATGALGDVAAVLADFSYDHLSVNVGVSGTDPEATLVVHGRAKNVQRRGPQEVELTVNIHGARAFVSRL